MACLTISADDEKRVKALGFLSNKGTDNFSGRIITVNGLITAAQNKCLSEAAELYGNGIVTLTTRLTIEVQGIPYDKIEDFRAYIAKEGLVTGGTGSKVRPIVACKGTTCQYGLIDTFGISEEIHEKFFNGYSDVKLPHKFKIGIGGCPNNCVKPDLNDLGIVGQMIPNYDEDSCSGCKKCPVQDACPINVTEVVDGVLKINKDECNHCGRCIGKCHFDSIEDGQVGYKIYIGGMWGKRVSPGIPLTKIFTTKEEVMDAVEKTILLYREQGKTGERLAQTIDRLGFEHVNAQILSNELFDIFAALIYPYLSNFLGLTANQFGFLAGAAINDTSSVAAAEATYGVLNNVDLNLGITVKLTRTTLIILIAIIFTVITIRKQSKANASGIASSASNMPEKMSVSQTVIKVFPWFILIFLLMAILNTLGVFQNINGASSFFKKGYKFLNTVALAGVGFKIQFKDLIKKGIKPIILGGCTWIAVATSSLIFINLFANYIG